MGLTVYRFSVEWARVEPVAGQFRDDALDHYEAVVGRCLELGLAPVVTFNHFTSPHWFAMRGGWLDADAPAAFARYGDRVMAVQDGVPVLGCLHWTLMDNFEWIFGYGHQLGLHSVDRATFARTPKPSAAVYAALVRGHGLPGGATAGP